MISDMSRSKAEGLAKAAKDAAAIENLTPGEALEKLGITIHGHRVWRVARARDHGHLRGSEERS